MIGSSNARPSPIVTSVNGQTGAVSIDGLVFEITTDTLSGLQQAQLAQLYSQGYVALKVTANDANHTVVLLSLDQTGETSFLSTNQPRTNLLDNSNFAIAQFGYGGNHGTQAYAADRWLLTSGSVSYVSGQGLQINGTIQQFLPSQVNPEDVSAFVGMYSGTAAITYDNSQNAVIVGSNGGVVKYAALYQGFYIDRTEPTYESPDYTTEMQKCRMYAISSAASARYVGDGGSTTDVVRAYIPTGVKMRTNPTAYPSTSLAISARVQTGAYNDTNASISSVTADSNGLLVQVTGSTQIINSEYANCTLIMNTAIGFFADL